LPFACGFLINVSIFELGTFLWLNEELVSDHFCGQRTIDGKFQIESFWLAFYEKEENNEWDVKCWRGW
jgi:hypothetical protein